MNQPLKSSQQPSFGRISFAWLARLVRRRFFRFVVLILFLLCAVTFSALALVFRPSTINEYADLALQEALSETAEYKFNKDATSVEFPGLDGKGKIVLRDLVIGSSDGAYDVVNVPEIVVEYDLYGLPKAPLTRVLFPDGVDLTLNIDEEGQWQDQSILKKSEKEAPPPDILLPEVFLRDAILHYRIPQVLRDPSEAYLARHGPLTSIDGNHFYQVQLDFSLRRDTSKPGRMAINARCDGGFLGETRIVGDISSQLLKPDVNLWITRSGQKLNNEVVDLLADEPGKVVDYFYIEDEANTFDLYANASFRDGKFDIDAQFSYEGSGTFVNVPIPMENVKALVRFDGRDLTITDVSATVKGAKVRASGVVANIIEARKESVDIQIEARSLALTPELLEEAGGIDDGKGGYRFPEWERRCRPNAIRYPKSPRVIRNLAEQFNPSGLVDLDLRLFDDRAKGGTSVEVTAKLLQVSASYSGSENTLAQNLASQTGISQISDSPSLRALDRLRPPSVNRPRQEQWAPSGHGFPLPLYHIQGVISGSYGPTGGNFTTRGFGSEEATRLQTRTGIPFVASERLRAQRFDSGQEVQVDTNLQFNRLSDRGDEMRLALELSSPRLAFDSGLESILPYRVRQSLKGLELGGTQISIDDRAGVIALESLNVSVVQQPDEDPEIALEVECALTQGAASVRCESATDSVQLRNISAKLNYFLGKNLVLLTDVRGELLNGAALSIPEIRYDASKPPSSALTMRGDVTGIAVNDDLLNILPSVVRKSLRRAFSVDEGANARMSLEGKANLHLEVHPANALEKGYSTIFIDLFEGECSLADLRPLGFSEISLQAEARLDDLGTNVQIISLQTLPLHEASLETKGLIRASGSLFLPPGKGDARVQLSVEGNNLLLAPEVRRALDRRLRSASPSSTEEGESTTSRVWKQLEPAGGTKPIGRINANASIGFTLAAQSPVDESPIRDLSYLAEIMLEKGNIEFERFPLPLSDVCCRVVLSPDAYVFSDMSAKVADAFVDADRPSTLHIANIDYSDNVFSISLAVRDLRLNRNFAQAIPEDFRQVHSTIDPEGWATGTIHLAVSNDRVEYDAKLSVDSMALSFGPRFTQCQGTASLQGTAYTEGGESPEGRHVAKGAIEMKSMKWNVITFTDMTSALQFSEDRLALPNVRAKLHGGFVKGRVDIETGSESGYRGAITATGVSLKELTADQEWAKSSDKSLVGGLDAQLIFFNQTETGLVGRGRIDIGREPLPKDKLESAQDLPPEERAGSSAKLESVPIFDGLYQLLGLSEGEYFDEAHMIFWLMTDRMVIRQLNLISDALRIEASSLKEDENYILYEPTPDGDQLSLVLLPTAFPRMISPPVVFAVVDVFKELVLRVWVSGSLAKPVVEPGTQKTNDDESSSKEKTNVYPDYSLPDD